MKKTMMQIVFLDFSSNSLNKRLAAAAKYLISLINSSSGELE